MKPLANKSIKIIGIDPGKTGGIAIYYKGQVRAAQMPENFANIIDTHRKEVELIVFLEMVSAYSSDARENIGKQMRIIPMVKQYEQMKTTLQIFCIPYVEVHPRTWQNGLKLYVKGSSKIERKARFKRAAQNWYKELKVTNYTADALCIMHFARQKLLDKKWMDKKLQVSKEDEIQF